MISARLTEYESDNVKHCEARLKIAINFLARADGMFDVPSLMVGNALTEVEYVRDLLAGLSGGSHENCGRKVDAKGEPSPD